MSQIGTAGLIKQPTARVYSPATGWAYVESWIGDQDDADAQADALAGTGVTVSVEPLDGGRARLTVTDSGDSTGNVDNQIQTVWTLIPQVEHVEPWEVPAVVAEIDSLSAANKWKLSEDIAAIRRGEVPPNYDAGTWSGYGDIALALQAFAGQKTYITTRATLRKSRTVSARSSQTADWVGVMKIWTTAQIIAAEAPPSTIIGTLETGDWLKVAAGVEQLSDGRFVITTEWWYRESGCWDTDLMYAVHS